MKLIDIVRECVREGRIDAVNKSSIDDFQRIYDERALRLDEAYKTIDGLRDSISDAPMTANV